MQLHLLLVYLFAGFLTAFAISTRSSETLSRWGLFPSSINASSGLPLWILAPYICLPYRKIRTEEKECGMNLTQREFFPNYFRAASMHPLPFFLLRRLTVVLANILLVVWFFPCHCSVCTLFLVMGLLLDDFLLSALFLVPLVINHVCSYLKFIINTLYFCTLPQISPYPL